MSFTSSSEKKKKSLIRLMAQLKFVRNPTIIVSYVTFLTLTISDFIPNRIHSEIMRFVTLRNPTNIAQCGTRDLFYSTVNR